MPISIPLRDHQITHDGRERQQRESVRSQQRDDVTALDHVPSFRRSDVVEPRKLHSYSFWHFEHRPDGLIVLLPQDVFAHERRSVLPFRGSQATISSLS